MVQSSMASTNTIAVGISGGVDSATTAYLLKSAGHTVHGLFMRNWHDDEQNCSALQDQKDAQAVCDHLNIPLEVIDFSEAYKTQIFNLMLKQLQMGLTPNPDILCNEHIKFGCLLHHVKQSGADYLATGHYAQIINSPEPSLYQGLDPLKDQSYFLCRMPKSALSQTLFPLGIYQKQTIREIAKQARLPVAQKKDSTGLCFIGKRDFKDFISQYLLDKPGVIVTEQGSPIGQHSGLFYHTLGQRKGLQIGGQPSATQAPWYVIEKDLNTNRLIVTQNTNHPNLWSHQLYGTDPYWFYAPPVTGRTYKARVRHGQAPQTCSIIHITKHYVKIRFDKPQRAITPGQYCVLYEPSGYCIGSCCITHLNDDFQAYQSSIE